MYGRLEAPPMKSTARSRARIRRGHRRFGARRGHAARRHRLGTEAHADGRYLERDRCPLQPFRDLQRFAILDDMGVGEHVPEWRDHEPASRPDLDAIEIDRPLDPGIVELGVDAAGQPDEDGRVGGRFRALSGSGAGHQSHRHRQDNGLHELPHSISATQRVRTRLTDASARSR